MVKKTLFFLLCLSLGTLLSCSKKEEFKPSGDKIDPTAPFAMEEECPKEKTSSVPTIKRGYYIQMGSFKEKENAIELQKTIEGWGYATETEGLNGSKGNWTVLLVGPFFEQSDAVKHQLILEKRTGIKKTLRKELTR